MLAGVKMAEDGVTTFVSVPRWRANVPATLNKLVTYQYGDEQVTLLEPYPSWEMNEIGNPDALQSVLGFEVDPLNRIWILDQGKVDQNPAVPGSIKLLIYDIITDELIQKYVFPEDQAPLDNSFLNDVVVDLYNNFAYISDTGLGSDPVHGGLLVYDFNTNSSRRVLNQVNGTSPDPSVWFSVNDQKVFADGPMEAGADGIALTPSTETLYFCPLASRILYSIPTALLRNFSIPEEELELAVTVVMNKETTSDGLACSDEGDQYVYATGLEVDGLVLLKVNSSVDVIVNDTVAMQWPDTIGFDHHGSIVFVSNKLQLFWQGVMDFTDENFRIWKVYIGANSYLDAWVQ